MFIPTLWVCWMHPIGKLVLMDRRCILKSWNNKLLERNTSLCQNNLGSCNGLFKVIQKPRWKRKKTYGTCSKSKSWVKKGHCEGSKNTFHTAEQNTKYTWWRTPMYTLRALKKAIVDINIGLATQYVALSHSIKNSNISLKNSVPSHSTTPYRAWNINYFFITRFKTTIFLESTSQCSDSCDQGICSLQRTISLTKQRKTCICLVVIS